jgi:divalent metal cation (Fe/Co/Zn/Cd) transporter
MRSLRVRESGDRVFADVVVKTSRTSSLAQAHDTAEQVEEALRSVDDRSETLFTSNRRLARPKP